MEKILTLLLEYTTVFTLASFIVVNLYKTIAKRDMLKIEWIHSPNTFGMLFSLINIIIQLIKYAVIFPLYTALWVVFLSITIYILSSTEISYALFISSVLTLSTRIMSYVDQESAQEIAKMMPLSLIFSFIVQPTSFSLSILEKIGKIFENSLSDIILYTAVIAVVELLLRVFYIIVRR